MKTKDAKSFGITTKTMFTSEHFVSGIYSSKEKASFANHFIKFIKSNFDKDLFTEDFYRRLCNCRGHIAHYDQEGFWAEWFSEPHRRLEFVRVWIHTRIYGDPIYTFSDVERSLKYWLVNHNVEEKQKEIVDQLQLVSN